MRFSSSLGDFCSCGFLRKKFARYEWRKIGKIYVTSQEKKYEYHNHLLEIRHTRLPCYRLDLLLGHVLGYAVVAQQRSRHLEFEARLDLMDFQYKKRSRIYRVMMKAAHWHWQLTQLSNVWLNLRGNNTNAMWSNIQVASRESLLFNHYNANRKSRCKHSVQFL